MVHRFRYIWPDQLHIMGHARSLENDMSLRPLAFILLPFFLISAFWSLWRVTGRQKSQVIYAHWVIPNGLIAACVAALRGLPFIISLHGSDIFVANRNRIFKVCARWIFRRAAAVTACSNELKRKAISLGASANTVLLAWGADPQLFHPDQQKIEINKSSPTEETPLVISTLGRMVSKKGFDILLSAMPIVLENNKNLLLIMGGDGILKDSLKQQANQLGISEFVSFRGRISWEKVPEFLANSDIFVLPSIKDPHGNLDGLPTVLLEAMSSGCAVVASELGGVSLVIEDGQNGLLVPPGDIAALADTILYLIINPLKRAMIAQAARQSILETYNWELVTQKIAALLEQAIDLYKKNRP